jgi:hypothetical protein
VEIKTAGEEWAKVEEKLKGLWPNTYQKNYTHEMRGLWKKILGHISYESVVGTLEFVAAGSPFFPRPYDIQRLAAGKKKTSTISQDGKPQAQQLEEYRQEQSIERQFYSKLTEKQKTDAAAEILSRNPLKARCLAKLPLTHPGWRAMIIRMLRDGIVDTDGNQETLDI